MNHCMIDCETLGLTPGCAILSIGAIVFDPDDSSVLYDDSATLRLKVDLLSSVMAGMTIEPATLDWWSNQSAEARVALDLGVPRSLRDALLDLHGFYTANSCMRVWANGPMADIAWLEEAYRRIGVAPPWSYNVVRDFRTVWELGGLEDRTEPGVAHDALDDARAQAIDVIRAIRATRRPAGS